MKKVLYFQDSGSNKFWQVEQSGQSLTFLYGKIGSTGKTTVKEYPTAELAALEYEKALQKKIKSGYSEELKSESPISWAYQKIDEKTFWDLLSLLNWKKQGNDELVLKPAIAALSQMDLDEIYAFEDLLAKKLHAIDTRAIAEKAYKSLKNLSADDFLYVRCVALINGPEYYEEILTGKEALDKDMEFEAILTLAQEAYELKTKKDYEYSSPVSYESFANAEGWK